MDEVLAVGDAEFQKKCLGKMDEVAKEEGRTILSVSSNMSAVQTLCQYALVIKNGSIIYRGTSEKSVNIYLERNVVNEAIPIAERQDRHGIGTVKITNLTIHNSEGREADHILSGDKCALIFIIENKDKPIKNGRVLFTLYDQNGKALAHFNTYNSHQKINLNTGKSDITCTLLEVPLRPGYYTINVALMQAEILLDRVENAAKLIVIDSKDLQSQKLFDYSSAPYLIRHSWS